MGETMKALVRDLELEVGSYYRDIIRLTSGGQPYDLTGATLAMHIRDSDGNLLVALTNANGRLAVTGPGEITRTIYATDTVDITEKRAAYDLEVSPDANADLTFKVYRGAVRFIRENTFG
jgi:hypothetical protein